MSETAKRLDSTPESYAPKDKPEIIRMAEVLYAGSYVCAPGLETEPDVEASWHFFLRHS